MELTLKNYVAPLLTFLTLALPACNYQKIKNSPDSFVLSNESIVNPGYRDVYEAVFKPRCIYCHSAADGNAGGVNLETYARTFANIDRIQDAVIDGMYMPPASQGSLSTTQFEILNNWITQGAPATATEGSR